MSSRPIDDDASGDKPAAQARLTSSPDRSDEPVGLHSGLDLLGEQAGIGDIEFAAPNHPDLAAPATFD
jgi:hypothetical protein